MSIELITIKELLRDPQYRSFFTKVPELPAHYTPENKPWKLMILKQGERAWRSKRTGTYEEAFAGLKKMLPLITNGAINCPALGFRPPTKTYRIKGKTDAKGNPILKTVIWRPQISADMEQHHWCPHCRRPSIFHIATLNRPQSGQYKIPTGEPVNRCIICGVSERVIDLRHPELEQGWDMKLSKLVMSK